MPMHLRYHSANTLSPCCTSYLAPIKEPTRWPCTHSSQVLHEKACFAREQNVCIAWPAIPSDHTSYIHCRSLQCSNANHRRPTMPVPTKAIIHISKQHDVGATIVGQTSDSAVASAACASKAGPKSHPVQQCTCVLPRATRQNRAPA